MYMKETNPKYFFQYQQYETLLILKLMVNSETWTGHWKGMVWKLGTSKKQDTSVNDGVEFFGTTKER